MARILQRFGLSHPTSAPLLIVAHVHNHLLRIYSTLASLISRLGYGAQQHRQLGAQLVNQAAFEASIDLSASVRHHLLGRGSSLSPADRSAVEKTATIALPLLQAEYGTMSCFQQAAVKRYH